MPEPTREEILAVLTPFAEIWRKHPAVAHEIYEAAAALHARLSQPVAEPNCPYCAREGTVLQQCEACGARWKEQPAAESAEPGPSDTLPRRVGYSTTTGARLIGSCADELEQLGQWVRAARDFDRDDAVDEIARAIENRVRELRAAMRKERL